MAKRSKKKPIRMCVDRVIAGDRKIEAAAIARKINPDNLPQIPGLLGISRHPAKLAFVTGKRWKNGQKLGVRFLDGSQTQQQRVIEHAMKWCDHANLKLNFNAGASAEIRISFEADDSSWSAVGTDCLSTPDFPKNEPTMNYGWLEDDTEEDEYNRVVLHEFGHALAAIHEHQNPRGGIKWNTAAVYKYFAGAPNFWSKEDTYYNVIMKYKEKQLNATEFDPDSIMLYSFDAALIKGGKATRHNTDFSPGDIAFIKKMYPK